jgi:hypothetical protein
MDFFFLVPAYAGLVPAKKAGFVNHERNQFS